MHVPGRPLSRPTASPSPDPSAESVAGGITNSGASSLLAAIGTSIGKIADRRRIGVLGERLDRALPSEVRRSPVDLPASLKITTGRSRACWGRTRTRLQRPTTAATTAACTAAEMKTPALSPFPTALPRSRADSNTGSSYLRTPVSPLLRRVPASDDTPTHWRYEQPAQTNSGSAQA